MSVGLLLPDGLHGLRDGCHQQIIGWFRDSQQVASSCIDGMLRSGQGAEAHTGTKGDWLKITARSSLGNQHIICSSCIKARLNVVNGGKLQVIAKSSLQIGIVVEILLSIESVRLVTETITNLYIMLSCT